MMGTYSMLKLILNDLQSGKPRSIPYWNYLQNSMDVRQNYWRNRYNNSAEQEHKGTYILKNILGQLNINDLMNRKNDYDTYLFDVVPMINGVRTIFDPVWSTNNFFNCFSHGPNPITDVFLNCSYRLPLTDLPMNTPYEYWRNLSPLNVVYYDSLEFVERIDNVRLDFQKPVNYVVWGLNVPLLIMKYIKWMRYYANTLHQPEESVKHFLKYEVFRLIFDDLINVWTLNIITDSLIKFPNIDRNAHSWFSGFKYAMNDIYTLGGNLNNGAITAGDFCATTWLANHQSITEYIKLINRNIFLPELRQYYPIDFLKEYNIIKLIALLYRRGKDPKSTKIIRQLGYVIRRYRQSCMTNPLLYNLGIRGIVNHKFNELQQLF